MRTGWYKIIVVVHIFLLLSCRQKSEINHPAFNETLLEKWVETEVLHQKYSSEKKYHDTITCIHYDDNLSSSKKDSIIRYWSEHPEVLKTSADNLINKK
ncbi:MAG: hypothetical protein N2203_05995 [Bacteroidia bacterium]|nr:hypothetical protein [Bacteroidia bacterium]